jgi:predicted DNA-binding transcriptional regulator AlpA
MKDLSKPIYSLTVEEYLELNKKAFASEAERIIRVYQNSSNRNNNDIIFIDEVVELTGYKKSTIYSKVCRYEMPVISKRTPLTFSRKEIIIWLKEGKPSVIDQEANEYLNKS